MSDVVFILGAGASKDAGVPLMADFLGAARDLAAIGRAGAERESFDRVFQAIGKLQAVHSKCDLDLQNVESVFAALEMGKILGKFADYDTKGIGDLIDDMKILITKTIEQTLILPIENTVIKPPPPYGRFCDMVKYLTEAASPVRSVSVITFNYDLALDRSLAAAGLKPHYGFEEANENDGIPLLKLHGSLNWVPCEDCRRIYPLDVLPKRFEDFYPGSAPPRYASSAHMPILTWLETFDCCQHNPPKRPFIVPPTWNKSSYHSAMPKVWAKAASELAGAEYIFMMGYSFPESDAFFHHLYGLGSVSDTPLRGFWVFNPAPQGVEDRFRKLLGRGAERVFQYHRETFQQGIEMVWNSFRPNQPF